MSKVAKQVQGVSCDDDWQSEGSRIVGVLRYPHPISAYTRIADEVAESLLEVHNELTVQGEFCRFSLFYTFTSLVPVIFAVSQILCF